MENELKFKIATQFTKTPSGRYRKDCEHGSAEELKHDYLIPLIRKAISEDKILTIDLSDTYGYAISFLDEAFGDIGLILNLTQLEYMNKIHLICSCNDYVSEIYKCIEEKYEILNTKKGM